MKGANKTARKSAPVAPDPEMLETKDLFLDPLNPRLTDSDFSIGDQDKILKRLWTEFNVAEIVDSIVTSNAFWKHEPLVAVEERSKLIVIEGNRRLAALRRLRDAFDGKGLLAHPRS